MKNDLSTKAERSAFADYIKRARAKLKEENIKGIKPSIRRKRGELVLRLSGGSADDRFLALEALHKHTASRPKQRGQVE